jgi:predicted secreted protein
MPHNDDARHWRRRAQEAIAQAKDVDDHGSKQMMLTIVRGYEVLAKKSEQQASEHGGAILRRL